MEIGQRLVYSILSTFSPPICSVPSYRLLFLKFHCELSYKASSSLFHYSFLSFILQVFGFIFIFLALFLLSSGTVSLGGVHLKHETNTRRMNTRDRSKKEREI